MPLAFGGPGYFSFYIQLKVVFCSSNVESTSTLYSFLLTSTDIHWLSIDFYWLSTDIYLYFSICCVENLKFLYMCSFYVQSGKFYTWQNIFTRAPPMVPVTIIRHAHNVWSDLWFWKYFDLQVDGGHWTKFDLICGLKLFWCSGGWWTKVPTLGSSLEAPGSQL